MNLFRFVDSIGYRPVLMGQIKGFLNHYRNPETQRAFAEKHQQKPAMVASFADGSKLAIESAIIGNATGFVPGKRGMYGHECKHVKDLLTLFEPADLRTRIVVFVLGAEPHPGALGWATTRTLQEVTVYFKMGEGRSTCSTPYHLRSAAPHTVARACCRLPEPDAARLAGLDTVRTATRPEVGETLDGMGGFTCYGLVDSYAVCSQHEYLPIALSGGCRLLRDIAKDEPISYRDVELPKGRLCDRLRAEQTSHFAGERAPRWSRTT